ncbi:VRR-NUC domain-containing protein [Flavobacteriales bacterium]|nr:VRR-NUC domain-containing protein [Flavobacteriales bacterium]
MARKKATKNNRHGEGSEHDIQCRLARFIDDAWPDVLWCASAGGARTSMREAKRLKASGYKRGFPDVFVYEPRGRWHGLAIELKKEKGGRVSASQREWIAALEARGYRAVVAKGFEAAKEVLTEYLGTTPSSGI